MKYKILSLRLEAGWVRRMLRGTLMACLLHATSLVAEEETPEIQANLYFLLMRYETSTAAQFPDAAALDRSDRQFFWLSSGELQSARLQAGQVSGPHRYQGAPYFAIGRENAEEAGGGIQVEGQCELSGGDTLVLLFPTMGNALVLGRVVPVRLPRLADLEGSVLVLNLSPHQLAVNVSGGEDVLHIESLQFSELPREVVAEARTLSRNMRLEMAANEEGAWKRIPGTRLLLSGEDTQVVIVHPSFTSVSAWTVRTQRLRQAGI